MRTRVRSRRRQASLRITRHGLRAIRDIGFGTIEIVVHQSQIVHITRSEKVRFDAR